MAEAAVLYGLRNCDTCRKALKALGELDFVDVRSEGVPQEVLDLALLEFGNALVNTRSTTWRNLSDEERTQDPKALLKAHPTLMKRPLIRVDKSLFLGWNNNVEEAVKAAL